MNRSAVAIVCSGFAAVAVLVFLLRSISEPVNPVAEKTILLYCAAGVKPPVERAVRSYEAEFGVPFQIQYDGSGTLLSNLRVARRGDLYLSADDSYMKIAREKGLIAEVVPLARMQPVIAVLKGNPRGIRSIDDLIAGDHRISAANPDAAAVGKVVRTALMKTGQWEKLAARIKAFKPTVNGVANDLKIGSADAVIVWDSTANQYPEFEIVTDPAFAQSVGLISIGVLMSCEQPAAALHFARYLGARDRGLLEFEKLGYEPVDGDKWAHVPEVVLFSGGVNRLAIRDTIEEFNRREGVEFVTSFNGCGILVGEMKAGKRPDAYFACDVSFMDAVEELFDTSVDISETRMVILVQKGNPKKIGALGDLVQEGLRLGVANAEQSALGGLTRTLLVQEGIFGAVMKNVLTQVPTADLLVNKIRARSLDAVVVYEANTSQVRDLTEIVVIDRPSARAIQPFAVGAHSDHKHLVGRFLDRLGSRASRERFESVGFGWRRNPDLKKALDSEP